MDDATDKKIDGVDEDREGPGSDVDTHQDEDTRIGEVRGKPSAIKCFHYYSLCNQMMSILGNKLSRQKVERYKEKVEGLQGSKN